jgi:hypothetical protein
VRKDHVDAVGQSLPQHPVVDLQATVSQGWSTNERNLAKFVGFDGLEILFDFLEYRWHVLPYLDKGLRSLLIFLKEILRSCLIKRVSC